MLKISHFSSILSIAVLAVVSATSAQTYATDPESVSEGVIFPKPERIRYDSHSLIIDGKPVFIYSGAFHYFRCPRELWKERLEQMKAAGLNCVETYLAWNVHEPEEPAETDDYSKLRDMDDINDFISTARKVGLYVIIRPGPYICAEWDRGGLPGWLLKDRPKDVPFGSYLRGNNPRMLAWDRHWITAAAKVVKPHLVTNLPAGAPGVILWQLENEYEYSTIPADEKVEVLRNLAHDAIENGIDVPLFTCYSKNKAFREDSFLRSHVYDTTNSYPGFNMQSLIDGIQQTAAYQPEKFRAVSELQGGWFALVRGKLSDQQGLNAAQINQLTLVAIEEGVTSMNYYMFYGGSNFGYGAARGLIQSYDYNAPLREPGGIGDRYLAVKAIAEMLKMHGESLARAEHVDLIIGEKTHNDVLVSLRKAADGAQYYFLRTPQKTEARVGSVTVQPQDRPGSRLTISYDLPPFGAKIFYLAPGITDPTQGKWLPKPALAPPRPEIALSSVPVGPIFVRPESSATWVNVPERASLTALNIFDQRYVTYRISFSLTESDLQSPLVLRVRTDAGGKIPLALINGQQVKSVPSLHYGEMIPLAQVAHTGTNTAEILYENAGAPNFGADIEKEQGVTEIRVAPVDESPDPISDWRMKRISNASGTPSEVGADFEDRDWRPVSIEGRATLNQPNSSAVFRGTLNITTQQITNGVRLAFSHIDDRGTVYINGQEVGTADDWSHSFTFDVTAKLHEGRNTVAVVVHNDSGVGGLYGGCYFDPAGKLLSHVQVAAESDGQLNHWEMSPLTADWHSQDPKEMSTQLLAWYRMEFETPKAQRKSWIPWQLHLEADLNAFVYLNGHLLGRYWATGPQRDMWLPECWLNQDGKRNVIALQARMTADGLPIRVAEIRPYVEFAEEYVE